MIEKLTYFNHIIWKSFLKEGMIALDCTVGKGNDAKFLLDSIGDEGYLYGFDVQSQAIEMSKEKLGNKKNYKLIHRCHSEINKFFTSNSVDAIIYNLGFLPGGEKNIATNIETTQVSICHSLNILKVNGLMSISIYPGHKEGNRESKALDDYLSNLDSKIFHVLSCRYENQKEIAPYTVWITKKEWQNSKD